MMCLAKIYVELCKMLCKIQSLNLNADADADADTSTDTEMLMTRIPNSLINLSLNTDLIYL